MMDIFSKEKRSYVMSQVKSKNTKPEIVVRSILHRMGYRFRIHRKNLPGKPDIVLPRYRKIIFVHGCFWHGHKCKRLPKTQTEYWKKKISNNRIRDKDVIKELNKMGWRVYVIWECEIKDSDFLIKKLNDIMND